MPIIRDASAFRWDAIGRRALARSGDGSPDVADLRREREARVARELIEAAGGHVDEAARIAEAVRTPGPTLEAAVAEHIDLLTGVGPDTRSHYRGQLRTHIAPVLGPYPVAAITSRHIAGWVRAMSEKGPSPKTIANVHGLSVHGDVDGGAARVSDRQPMRRCGAAEIGGDA